MHSVSTFLHVPFPITCIFSGILQLQPVQILIRVARMANTFWYFDEHCAANAGRVGSTSGKASCLSSFFCQPFEGVC